MARRASSRMRNRRPNSMLAANPPSRTRAATNHQPLVTPKIHMPAASSDTAPREMSIVRRRRAAICDEVDVPDAPKRARVPMAIRCRSMRRAWSSSCRRNHMGIRTAAHSATMATYSRPVTLTNARCPAGHSRVMTPRGPLVSRELFRQPPAATRVACQRDRRPSGTSSARSAYVEWSRQSPSMWRYR